MSLNCVEIEEVLKTFPQNGLIKNTFQPNKSDLIINLYDGKKDMSLLISIMDKYNRICISPKMQRSSRKDLRFSQNLNANIAGGRIKKIFQNNMSRIVLMEIENNKEIFKLIIRLWGAGSNILLTYDDYEIIDCIRRMPKRNEWPKEYYELPEQKNKDNKYTIRSEFKNKDINKAIFGYYDKLFEELEYKCKKEVSQNKINKEIKIMNSFLNKTKNNLSEKKCDNYKSLGELINTNLDKIKKGDKEAELTDYMDNKKVKVKLLPNLSPIENAQRYFNKYKKMKKGRENWINEKNKAMDKLNVLEHYKISIKNTTNIKELISLEKKLNKLFNRSKIVENKNDKILPGRQFYLEGDMNAFVSRSSSEADQILKLVARGNDYWFHIRDYAGSHVVVKEIKGKEISEKAKLEAAMLAHYFSKARKAEESDIYFTRVKYLHKSKGGHSGLVFPTREKNIKVKLDQKILDKIFSR